MPHTPLLFVLTHLGDCGCIEVGCQFETAVMGLSLRSTLVTPFHARAPPLEADSHLRNAFHTPFFAPFSFLAKSQLPRPAISCFSSPRLCSPWRFCTIHLSWQYHF